MALDYLLAAGCALLVYAMLFRPYGAYQLGLTGWYARTWLPALLASGCRRRSRCAAGTHWPRWR